MVASESQISIDIRPAVSVYATYRRLSYQPWYAIAEFVDNSTQSFYDHRAELIGAYKLDGGPGNLRVEVAYDSERNALTIVDNAHGMEIEELTRAVVLDRPPPDPSGRCEYGMGLKTAACWFGTTWTIRTTKLGSSREYTARVHVPELVYSHLDSIAVEVGPAEPKTHYTSVTIEGLYKPIRGRTQGRVKDQLGSMYREDLRSREIEILWNGEPISYEEPSFLERGLAERSQELMEGRAFHPRCPLGIRRNHALRNGVGWSEDPRKPEGCWVRSAEARTGHRRRAGGRLQAGGDIRPRQHLSLTASPWRDQDGCLAGHTGEGRVRLVRRARG